ncbi:MAG: hypothetical protein ACRDDY_09690 [Clostridium sp.]|uniref:hypothetical protein n=1 Tax=Clostridium sp. TaxID=1506 RepID=UPI003EE5B1E4
MSEYKGSDLLGNRLSDVEVKKSEVLFKALESLSTEKFKLDKESLKIYEILNKSLGQVKWIIK